MTENPTGTGGGPPPQPGMGQAADTRQPSVPMDQSLAWFEQQIQANSEEGQDYSRIGEEILTDDHL
jgi:hypothetical protein